ncbi:MAG: hypothetical protein R6X35_15400 [Candidatus Krumholzibacteriia bacterium]
MFLLFGVILCCLAALLAESLRLRRARRGVRLRIIVTGTRGKSSLVRILTAACRAEVPATLGKTTGDAPELLLPDGTCERLRRRGPARLTEQIRLLERCRALGIECLVVESMTITPEVMRAETRLLRPTHAAVVNVRDDHRETLGDDPDAQRAHYLAALPAEAVCLTRDRRLLAQAKAAGGPVFAPLPDGAEADPDRSVPDSMLRLAYDVLGACGLDTPRARQAARTAAAGLVAAPRPVAAAGGGLTFLDAFSANDPESFAQLWAHWRQRLGSAATPWTVLLATRADRPLRTIQFCRWLAARDDVDEVLLAGSHAPFAARVLRRLGVPVRALRHRQGDEPAAVLALAAAGGPLQGKVLVGAGNAGGAGLRLRRALAPGGDA